MSIFQIQMIRRKGDKMMAVSSAAMPRIAAKKILKNASRKLLMDRDGPVFVKLISRLVTYSGK
jgi:hypothetical protein